MLTLLIYVIVACLVAFGLVKLIDKFLPAKAKPIVSILLWIVAIFIGYLIYSSIMKPINFEKAKDERYRVAVSKLLDIKKTQLGYKAVHKEYANSFDKLVDFVENEKFAIISRKDTAVIDKEMNRKFGLPENATDGYYKDVVIIDTIGYVTVKDSLFKNNNRYKEMNVVKIGNTNVPISLEVNDIIRNDIKVPVFKAEIDKNAILSDLDQELVNNENKVEGIDKINGDKITLGSLEEAAVTGNWPKKYGSNE